jgi:hypothetical protein
MSMQVRLHQLCHNPILGYSLKFIFFKIKIKKSNKGWQCGESKSGNQAAILEEIQGLIVPHYAQNGEKNTNSRSN